MKINVKKLPGSMVEIEGELDIELFESYFKKALNRINEKVKLDGFRKGKAPENVLMKQVGEMAILEEMAELALGEYYPKIISCEAGGERIDAISRPEIGITKLARNNPLGFKITTAVMPTVVLLDYKNTAKKIISDLTDEDKNTEVTEADVESTIMDIRKSRAPKKHITEDMSEEEKQKVEKLPQLNAEFVKKL